MDTETIEKFEALQRDIDRLIDNMSRVVNIVEKFEKRIKDLEDFAHSKDQI